jgi:hypothetical protein
MGRHPILYRGRMSLGGIRSRRVGFVCVLETGSTINAKKSLRYGDIKRKSRDRVKDIDIYIFLKKTTLLQLYCVLYT